MELSIPELCDEMENKWFNILKPPTNFQSNKNFKKIECLPEGIKKRTYRINFKHSDETKLKMSKAQIGRVYIPKEMSSEKLNEIINLVNNENKTLTKLSKKYKHALSDIYKNLIRYLGENDFNILKNKSLLNGKKDLSEKNKLKSVDVNIRHKKIIPIILENYRNGLLIKEIRKIVNINGELIGLLIRNNMDKEELKKIRSRNSKRHY